MQMHDVINDTIPQLRACSGAERASICASTKRHTKNIQHIGIAGEIEWTMFQFYSWIYNKKAVASQRELRDAVVNFDIDVKKRFYFKIKNAFLTFFYFPNVFLLQFQW